MSTAPKSKRWLMVALLALVAAAASVKQPASADEADHDRGAVRGGEAARAPARDRGPAGRPFFDARYNHGRYYPSRGAFVRELPGGYRSFYFHGRPFFFVDGAWYVSGPGGFIVAEPPPGLIVSVLPPFYTTVWFGGVPYYYADDVYYRWDPGADAYEVMAPPPDADQPGPPAQAAPEQGPEGQLYIYPKSGQTQTQQAQDRYECHSWAASQTGFDPTQPGGGVAPQQNGAQRAQYRRAMTACLEARGYSVE